MENSTSKTCKRCGETHVLDSGKFGSQKMPESYREALPADEPQSALFLEALSNPDGSRLKKCSGCKGFFRVDSGEWINLKSSRDGLGPYCIACRKARHEKWEKSETKALHVKRQKLMRRIDPSLDKKIKERSRLKSAAERLRRPEAMREFNKQYIEKVGREVIRQRAKDCRARYAERNANRRKDTAALQEHYEFMADQVHAQCVKIYERLSTAWQVILDEDRKIKKQKQKRLERQHFKSNDPDRYREMQKRHKKTRKHRLRMAEGSSTLGAMATRALWVKQDGQCYYCHTALNESGGPQERYHTDHFIPLVLGGSNEPHNRVLACPACNFKKGAMHPDVFLAKLGPPPSN